MKWWSKVTVLVPVTDELPDDSGSWLNWSAKHLHKPLEKYYDEQYVISVSEPIPEEDAIKEKYKIFDEFGGV